MVKLTRDSLLESILAAPDADEPRLVFADWLAEHEEPERGEFIVADCQLARLDRYAPERRLVEARRHELFKAHRRKWLAPLDGLIHEGWFERGFVTLVSLAVADLDRNVPAIQRLEPVLHLRGLRFAATVDAALLHLLAHARCLTTIRALELKEGFLDDTRAGLLFEPDGTLHELQQLRLPHNELASLAARGLAQRPWRRLTLLDLANNRFDDDDLILLLQSDPVTQSLRTLDLGHNLVGDRTASALARAPLRLLESLSLTRGYRGEPITGVGAEALAASSTLGALKHLDLRSHPIGDAGARALGHAAFRLESIDLARTSIGEEGTVALAGSPRMGALRYLSLKECPIGDEGIAALAESPHLRLVRLDLTRCGIGDRGASMLATSEAFANLRSLHLKENRISAGPRSALRKRFGAGVCSFSR